MRQETVLATGAPPEGDRAASESPLCDQPPPKRKPTRPTHEDPAGLRARRRGRDVLFDLLVHGGDQFGLVNELVVQRATGHPRGAHGRLGADPREPGLGEEGTSRRNQERHVGCGGLQATVTSSRCVTPARPACRAGPRARAPQARSRARRSRRPGLAGAASESSRPRAAPRVLRRTRRRQAAPAPPSTLL